MAARLCNQPGCLHQPRARRGGGDLGCRFNEAVVVMFMSSSCERSRGVDFFCERLLGADFFGEPWVWPLRQTVPSVACPEQNSRVLPQTPYVACLVQPRCTHILLATSTIPCTACCRQNSLLVVPSTPYDGHVVQLSRPHCTLLRGGISGSKRHEGAVVSKGCVQFLAASDGGNRNTSAAADPGHQSAKGDGSDGGDSQPE